MNTDAAFLRSQILELRVKIDDHMSNLCNRIERIRDDAKRYERDAVDRTYSEIEPMRRQMEAMIKSLADYESLRAPASCILVT